MLRWLALVALVLVFPPLVVVVPWRTGAGVFLPDDSRFVEDALINFTGEFLSTFVNEELVVSTEPRLEGNGRGDEVLGGAPNPARGGGLPTIPDSVRGIFGGDGASPDVSNFPLRFEFD